MKLWICFLPNRKTSKIEHIFPLESHGESHEGTFVGIKEEDPSPRHLSLALAVGGLQGRRFGKLGGRAVIALAGTLG